MSLKASKAFSLDSVQSFNAKTWPEIIGLIEDFPEGIGI
jgi:hypothetical protein